MSWAVLPLPPIPQSPLSSSSTSTHVTGRRASPSIPTMVSVILWIISCLCSWENTPLTSFTSTSGMAASSLLGTTCSNDAQCEPEALQHVRSGRTTRW